MGFCFRRFTPLIIPTVYDDTVSYLEQLACIYRKMNEVGESVNELFDNIDSYIDDRIAEVKKDIEKQVDSVRSDLSKLQSDLDEFINHTSTEFDKVRDEFKQADSLIITFIQNEIKKVNGTIDDLDLKLSTEISKVERRSMDYTDAKVSAEKQERIFADEWLESLIENIDLTMPKMYNPFSGKKDTVQQILLDFYDGLAVLGITAVRYDSLELTAERYDNMELTAYEYDIYGGYILNGLENLVISPLDGKSKTLEQIVVDLVNILQNNGKTAEEYDTFDYTAEQFDNSTFDAKTQDGNKQYTDTSPDFKNNTRKYYQLVYEKGEEPVTEIEVENYKNFDSLLIEYEGVSGDSITKSVTITGESGHTSLDYVTGIEGAVTTYSRMITFLPNMDETILTIQIGEGLQNAVEPVDCCTLKKIYAVKNIVNLLGGE